jgi:hypothetical protein
MPIGHITLDVKLAGKPYAGKPHVQFDVAVAGDGADGPLEGDTHLKGEKQLGLTRSVLLPRQHPTLQLRGSRPVLRETGGEIPPVYSPEGASVNRSCGKYCDTPRGNGKNKAATKTERPALLDY